MKLNPNHLFVKAAKYKCECLPPLTVFHISGTFLGRNRHGQLHLVGVSQRGWGDRCLLQAGSGCIHPGSCELAIVRVVHVAAGAARIILSVILNYLPILGPVVIILTFHETVWWSAQVLFLCDLQLRLLLHWRQVVERGQDNGLHIFSFGVGAELARVIALPTCKKKCVRMDITRLIGMVQLNECELLVLGRDLNISARLPRSFQKQADHVSLLTMRPTGLLARVYVLTSIAIAFLWTSCVPVFGWNLLFNECYEKWAGLLQYEI